MRRKFFAIMMLALMGDMTLPLSAQTIFQRIDSVPTVNYRKVKYDTAYLMRPQTKWTVLARINVSGATIETEGIDAGQHYQSKMEANSKAGCYTFLHCLRSLSIATHP